MKKKIGWRVESEDGIKNFLVLEDALALAKEKMLKGLDVKISSPESWNPPKELEAARYFD